MRAYITVAGAQNWSSISIARLEGRSEVNGWMRNELPGLGQISDTEGYATNQGHTFMLGR